MNTTRTILAAFSLATMLVACTKDSNARPLTVNSAGTEPAVTAEVNRQLSVTLAEWSVTPDRQSVPPGAITIAARNPGRVLHDLVIVQSDAGAEDLPIFDSRADETKLKVIGRFQEFKSGEKEKQFALNPGTYLLICNLPDHYQDGMVARIVVK